MTLDQIKHYAISKHELNNQRYGSASYRLHLEMVAVIAQKFIRYIEPKSRLDVLAACWTHDLLEDTDVTLKELEGISNQETAHIVYCVSNEPGKTRSERNIKTYPKISSNPLAVYVKCCDRLVNGFFSQKNKPELFRTYQLEYPLFNDAIRRFGLYPKLWEVLDALFISRNKIHISERKRPALWLTRPMNDNKEHFTYKCNVQDGSLLQASFNT